ncbi:MAG: cellulase family glycosylhydrolase [Terracidiphilus sp.]|nr:cellulase family glycosylhydrolase [Terracidiphilus sp.]
MTNNPVYLGLWLAVGVAVEAQISNVPLHTRQYQIVDAKNHSIQLKSVNWYGFDEREYVPGGLDHAPLNVIVAEIKHMGFNSVRLPWANETLEQNPSVPPYAVAENPELKNKHAMEVMDAIVLALAKAHIMVILDNHVSRADWCCGDNDGNGLWANVEYPEEKWIADWKTIVQRYKHVPYVVGADLRNELRSGAMWAGTDPTKDWHAAAERGGNAILGINSKLLIIVEGPSYSTNLRDVAAFPIRLNVENRLVYSPHDYGMSQKPPRSYEELKDHLDRQWGYLLHASPATPLWVGEFGICQRPEQCQKYGNWFPYFIRYLKETGVSWGYWPLNGTQSSGGGRHYDAVENYGLLGPDYRSIAAPDVLKQLADIGLISQ